MSSAEETAAQEFSQELPEPALLAACGEEEGGHVARSIHGVGTVLRKGVVNAVL